MIILSSPCLPAYQPFPSFLRSPSSIFKSETHTPNHHLEPVQQPDTYLDRDYCLPQSTGYNYLDPNYFPANR